MTTPVRYGEHVKAEPGTLCELCNAPSLKPRTDHCHAHGWVRGVLCPRCNTLMAFIDRRVSLRKVAVTEPLTLTALVAYAARCLDCEPFGVDDLGPVCGLKVFRGDKKVTVLVRVVPSLKGRLAAYARSRGLTLNAAAIILLDQALSETAEQESRPD